MSAHSTAHPWILPRGLSFTVVIGGVLNPLNTSSLAAALVGIGRDFSTSAMQLALVVSIVYVVSSVAQPLCGSLALRWGPRRIFIAGLLLVLIAGVLGYTAPTIEALLVSRALIGLGTSSAYPASMMLLDRAAVQYADGVSPTRELGLLAVTGNVMNAAGLPIGGLIAGTLGWRWVFLINVPLATGALLATALFVPRNLNLPRNPTRLDWLGIVIFATTMTSLATGLTGPAATRWPGLTVLAGVGCAFVLWETRALRKGHKPFIDVGLIASSPALWSTYLRQLLLFGALYGMLYAGAQWLEVVKGLSPQSVGLAMLPQSLLSAFAAYAVARTNRVRVLLLGAGAATLIAGLCAMVAVAMSSIMAMATAAGLLGVSMGLAGVGNQQALYRASNRDQLGVTAGLLRTFSYIGGFFVTALMGLVYSGGVTHNSFAVFGALFIVCGAASIALSSPHLIAPAK